MNTKLNKTDYLILGIYFFVDFIMQFDDYYTRGAYVREYVFDFPAELIATCTTIYVLTFWITPKFVIGKKYVLYTLIALTVMIVTTGIEYTIGYWSGKNDWSQFPKGMDFIFKMISRSVKDVSFPFALLLTKKFYEGQAQIFEIKEQQKENELKLLRSQIDPHFLFNNLNTLDSLIDSNTEKAKEYINRLSLIYRYLIKTKDSEVMELSEEIQLAENYIFLIQTRFDKDYDFDIQNKAAIFDKYTPTGAIQTLLENVVKHNKPDTFPIKVSIIIEEDRLSVINTKSSVISNKESFGTGLQNLKTRYQLLSDQEITVINTEDEFKVTIPIIKLIEYQYYENINSRRRNPCLSKT
ncbi:sensor histidine kinase [Tenacibaculum sp. MEBiC06402]|uniref:sensor histidine kinase n=1 Tax=unclassified Tenacibaculum TaxID=2635139 RepID=UPI003B9C7A7E